MKQINVSMKMTKPIILNRNYAFTYVVNLNIIMYNELYFITYGLHIYICDSTLTRIMLKQLQNSDN